MPLTCPTQPRRAALLLMPVLGCVLALALLAPAGAFAAPAQEQHTTANATNRPRIFIAHSYHQQFRWTQLVNKGVAEALKDLNPVVETGYMDAKQRPGPEHLRKAAEELAARITRFRPNIVIAVDDAAQEYLVLPYLLGKDSLQVIFCGVNALPSVYGYPTANVSGVRERWHYRDGIKLLKQLVPKARRTAFLIEDTETGRIAVDELRLEERQGGPYALALAGVELVKSFQQWQQLVKHYQTRADALVLPLYHSLVDETTGKVVPADKVMAWTNSINRLPTLGLLDYAQEHGLLCGVLESGEEQGYLAGSMAQEVLTRRVEAGTLPVRVNKRGVVLLNLKTAQRLGLSIEYPLIESAGLVVR
jgi:ABC-type uncharacterized transport system substrate-binding protein